MLQSDCIDHGRKGTYYSAYCKEAGRNIGLHRQVLAEKLGVSILELTGVAMHLCNNKRCVNPEHIELGTQSQNLADAWSDGLCRSNPSNKLSEELRTVIRSSPLGARELARQLGVSHSAVSRIRNGKS